MEKENKRFAIVAPSGAGKGTMIKILLEVFGDTKLAVSATTRRPRKGEVDGDSYHFMSTIVFLIKKFFGYFAETDFHFGIWYGTPKKECRTRDHHVIFEVDVVGVRNLRKIFPDLIIIGLLPPSKEELGERLRKRGDTPASIAKRLDRYDYEAKEIGILADLVVVNDDLKAAASELLGFVAEKMDKTVITFDGLAASGKGAIASRVASRSGGLHLDSGLLYRFVAYQLQIILGLKPNNEEYLKHLQTVSGLFVTMTALEDQLRTPEVDLIVAQWAELPQIRWFVYMHQMRLVGKTNLLIAEGRDMAKIFPRARYKFSVQCPKEIRVRRRAMQYSLDSNEVWASITERDRIDQERKYNPVVFDPATMIPIDNSQPLEVVCEEVLQIMRGSREIAPA